MPESNPYYFYLWQHRYVNDADQITTRTCFGITKNITDRVKGYEGHVGHIVRFSHVWQGPERLIRELESRIKSDFYDETFVGTNNYRYEWIRESIKIEEVLQWVEWEVKNTFVGIVKIET